MFDNWIWDKNILKRISKHHQNSDEVIPIPDEMID
jgi:Zn-dependent oligopeptidase